MLKWVGKLPVTDHYFELRSRAETNTRFIRIFARLNMCSNTMRVFGCTVNDLSVLILAYFVINYKFKGI